MLHRFLAVAAQQQTNIGKVDRERVKLASR